MINNPKRIKFLKAELDRAKKANEPKEYLRGLATAAALVVEGKIPPELKIIEEKRELERAKLNAEIQRATNNAEQAELNKKILERQKRLAGKKDLPGEAVNAQTFDKPAPTTQAAPEQKQDKADKKGDNRPRWKQPK